jgi:hypothetical protein
MPLKEVLEKFGNGVKHEASDFVAGLVRESIQNPVNGLIEVGSKLSGHRLPELHLVDEKSKHAGVADFLGSTLGKTADFLLFNKLTHGKFAPNSEMTTSQLFRNGFQYGALVGGVFTPVGSTGDDFWSKRMENAEYGGLAFGVGEVAGVRGMKRLDPTLQSSELAFSAGQFGSGFSYTMEKGLHNQRIEESKTLHELKPLNIAPVPVPAVSSVPADSTMQPKAIARFADYGSVSGFTLNPDGTSSALSAAASASKQFVPWERRGTDGRYDASALAKRVDHAIHAMGMDRDDTVLVAQDGTNVVLKGKIDNKKELAAIINAARGKGLAAKVESDVEEV